MWRLCIVLWCSLVLAADEPPMVIVIPSYNNQAWYTYNLRSALLQQYHNFRIVYIDDASTDGTGELVAQYLEEWDKEKRTTLIRNKTRQGALYNLYHAIWNCHPDEIVVTLDGDDWLASAQVLTTLASHYADPNVWMTYGQFVYHPSGQRGFARAIPDRIIQENTIRYYDWVTTHLRTFYAALFQKIHIEDLLYQGSFLPMAWDLAFMWPMLEMASSHSRFIPDILYVYNNATPLNDHKVNLQLQRTLSHLIRSRPPYSPLPQKD
jgi:glycosyltransferase involved in cell wall biosynthesis